MTQPQSLASSAQIVKFNFQSDTLEAVRDGNSVWFPLRPICDAIGLDPEGQRQKLDRHEWAATCKLQATGADGKTYEMLCVDFDTLLMWMGTLDASRVEERIRPKLVLYQREVKVAIRKHFFPTALPQDQRIARLEDQVSMLLARQPQPAARQLPPRDDWQPRLEALPRRRWHLHRCGGVLTK